MISHKPHARYLLIGGLILIGLLALVASCLAGDEREPAGSEERLRALLTERYEFRKKFVAGVQKSVEFGTADIFDLGDAVTALYYAEADLCTSNAERIKVYEKLVETLKTHEGLAVWRADAGRMTEWEVEKVKTATLDARIDLERLRLGQRLPAR